MDLYSRLEELQGMTHLLIDDVVLLRPSLGELEPDPSDAEKAHRRFYIRAVFALVEAFVEQHRRLLIELSDANFITLDPKTVTMLREIKEILHADGSVEQRTRYLQVFDKIKAVYRAAGDGFGEPLNITFGGQGWETFQDAMEIRNGITHPKNVTDCWINDQHLKTVNEAHEWFKTLQNEFVRVARSHRQQHRW